MFGPLACRHRHDVHLVDEDASLAERVAPGVLEFVRESRLVRVQDSFDVEHAELDPVRGKQSDRPVRDVHVVRFFDPVLSAARGDERHDDNGYERSQTAVDPCSSRLCPVPVHCSQTSSSCVLFCDVFCAGWGQPWSAGRCLFAAMALRTSWVLLCLAHTGWGRSGGALAVRNRRSGNGE